MEAKKQFKLTDERAFYLIKHFEKLDNQALHYFQQLGHGIEEVNQALSSIGSKFYASFCENPFELIERIALCSPFEVIQQSNANQAFRYKIPFDGGIGTNTIINIKTIQHADKIKKVIRNGFQVNTTERNSFDSTNELVVVCNPLNEVITIFPGVYAPAFPTQLVDENEVEASKLFWENHAFIIKSFL